MTGRAATPPAPEENLASTKGERTKALILATALRLFREQGFDKTTMRAIATEAGLSAANAYLYFPSKDSLIQEFYAEVQRDRIARSRDVLAGNKKLADRLAAVLHAGIAEMTPFHEFAGTFIRTAADPRSPSNPFSADSGPARELGLAMFAEVVSGSTTRMDPRMREALPRLLWLADLGVTSFWVYDSSPDQARTRELIDKVTPMVARLVSASRLPGVRGMTVDVLRLVDRFWP